MKLINSFTNYYVQVDATKEGELAKEYFVQGFPTLILFRKGVKVEDYSGPRTSKEIVSYMRLQADPDWKPPPSMVLPLTMDNFTKTAKAKDMMVVWFYAPWYVLIFTKFNLQPPILGASTASSLSPRWRGPRLSLRAGV